MAMSVRERIKEVGVLKTLGFNSEAILGIIVGEAVCICAHRRRHWIALRLGADGRRGQRGGIFMPQLQNLSVTPFTAFVAWVSLGGGLGEFVHTRRGMRPRRTFWIPYGTRDNSYGDSHFL